MVLDIFYFHPYLGKWSHLTNIFQMGWNHQPDDLTWYEVFPMTLLLESHAAKSPQNAQEVLFWDMFYFSQGCWCGIRLGIPQVVFCKKKKKTLFSQEDP